MTGCELAHERFARIARAHPDALAVSDRDRTLSYAELDRKANQLAHHLRARGVGPETLVGISLERCPEQIVGMLGILKAGGAFLPLDLSYPKARLEFIRNDARPSVVLGHAELVADHHEQPVQPPDLEPENLAYVIYTSGSTGLPKGVLVHHAALANLVEAEVRALELSATDRILQFAPLAFDASVWEIFGALGCGASLHLERQEELLPGAPLWRVLHDLEITAVTLPPTALAATDADGLDRLRLVVSAGETCTASIVRRWAPGRRLLNAYGPTEIAVCATVATCREDEARPSIIGHAIANVTLHVLDEHLQPVAPGGVGELFVGGPGVARGYLGRPALTAERFVPDPVSGQRLYATGDLVRLLDDGALDYLGRRDHQVKLRGVRIELGEIEETLRRHPSVRDAIALIHDDASDDRRLLAYATTETLDDPRDAARTAQIERWRELYDGTYERETSPDPSFAVGGWNSSYTGLPIPDEEMREWVEGTVARIGELHPRRVLEIGCGSGLLLFRLAPRCERYVGTDFSAAAIRHIDRAAAGGDLEVSVRQADDLSGIDGPFDTVVVNSVAQYFPDQAYLRRVIAEAVRRMEPGGRIFLGDLRSLPLLEAFHASVAVAQASPSTRKKDLARRLPQKIHRDPELAIDPAFFVALEAVMPEIEVIAVMPRRGLHANELTRFRYDVILKVGARPAERGSDTTSWVSGRDVEQAQLLRQLEESSSDTICLAGVPNARLSDEHVILAWLRSEGDETVADLRARLASTPRRGVDPEQLLQRCDVAGWKAEIRWDTPERDGSLDLVMWRRDATAPSMRSRLAAAPLPPLSELASHPIRAAARDELALALRRHLAQHLPERMLPSSVIVLDAMPLTPNGKIDRAMLPRLAAVPPARGSPRTPLEARLVRIWAEVLGLDQVGTEDDFFELGGHSLLLTRVVARIRESLGIEPSLRVMLEARTIVALAAVLDAERGDLSHDDLGRSSRASSEASEHEPSFGQERLWLLQQVQPDSILLNVPLSIEFRGPLDQRALARALDEVVRRHETLRTTIREIDGRPRQVIAPASAVPLRLVDLASIPHDDREREADRRISADARRPFDLSTALLRVTLISLAPDRHILAITLHHIACDLWSLGTLVDELLRLLDAFTVDEPSPLPELVAQYADFARWQRERLTGEQLDALLRYWTTQLAGARDGLALPLDQPRPAIPDERGARCPIRVPEVVTKRLDDLATEHGCTRYMALLAAFQIFLHRLSGQDEILVGSPSAGRVRKELEPLIGFFLNTLVLRARVDADATFRQVLAQVRETALDAFAHQELPFGHLVAALQPVRDPGRSPLFQAWFVLQDPLVLPPMRSEVEIDVVVPGIGTSMFDLLLQLTPDAGGLGGFLEYRTDLFDAARISRFATWFQDAVRALVSSPDAPIARMLSNVGAAAKLREHEIDEPDFAFDAPGGLDD